MDDISKTVLCSNILLLDLSVMYECAYVIWILKGSMKNWELKLSFASFGSFEK